MSNSMLKTSMVICGFISLLFFYWVYAHSADTKQWIFALWWPALAAHQIEEYILAEQVLGKKYFFLNWFRSVGYNVSNGMSFVVNCLVSPLLVLAATFIGYNLDGWWLVIPTTLLTAELANGNWHISLMTHQHRYSPGVITALFVYIPLTMFMYFYFVSNKMMAIPVAIASIVAGYIVHVGFFRFVFPQRKDTPNHCNL